MPLDAWISLIVAEALTIGLFTWAHFGLHGAWRDGFS